MVYLKKTIKGDKTYYYIAKTYGNKFGKRYERIIAQFGEKDLKRKEQLLKQAKRQVQGLEYYENMFEAFIETYGYSQAKHNFFEHLKTFRGLNEVFCQFYWDRCIECFEKVTGNPFLKKNYQPSRKRGRPPLPRGQKRINVSIRAKHGVFHAFETLKDQLALTYNSEVMTKAIDWLVEKSSDYELHYTGQSIRLFDPVTMEVIAKIDNLPRKGGVEIFRSFRLNREYLQKLRSIEDIYKLSSRNQTITLTIALFAMDAKAWKGFHCRHGKPTKIKKRKKILHRVICSHYNQTLSTTSCITCKRFLGER